MGRTRTGAGPRGRLGQGVPRQDPSALSLSEDDAKPTPTIDLSSITEFESEQVFAVDFSRVEFMSGGLGFGAGRSASPTFPYKIEASADGEEYFTILYKTKNEVTRYAEFDELPPTRCRFVRLTMTDWPSRGTTFGIVEFTAFGKAVEVPNR